MQSLTNTHALHWEMYGVETIVSFSATATDNGFQLTLARDDAPVMSGIAADSQALLRVSMDLRRRLNSLGFGAQPNAQRAALPGGLCWGPSSPLDSSLITPLLLSH